MTRYDSKWQQYQTIWDNSQATGNDLLLLLALAGFRNKGVMYATKATLAEKMNCSVYTVDRSIKSLKALGELDWVRGSNFSSKANRYFIFLPGLDTPADCLAVCSKIPQQVAQEYPSSLLPLNSNETVIKDIYINNFVFDFLFDLNPGSKFWKYTLELSQALGLPASVVNEALAQFREHPVCKMAANDFERCKRWGKWLMKRKYEPMKGSKDAQLLEGEM